jgi:hypothetical protein
MVVLSCQNTNTTPLVEGPTIQLTTSSGTTTAGLELLRGQTRLAKDVCERPAGKLAVQRHDHQTPIVMTEL